MSRESIPQAVLEECKRQYMRYIPVSTIAEKMNINKFSLQYHVNKHWRDERTINRNDLLREVSQNKVGHITKIASVTLNIILKALQNLENQTEPLSAKDAKMVSDLYLNLDKVLRLDAGDPTDILANIKPSTAIEIKARLNKDPFAITEADYKELPQGESNENEENENNVNDNDDSIINVAAFRNGGKQE